jgi:predicted metal-dependent enzyme (double-stranded beta helix superfamily)
VPGVLRESGAQFIEDRRMRTGKDLPSVSRRELLIGAAVTAAVGSAKDAKASRTQGAARFDVQRFVEDCRTANQGVADAQAAVQDVLARAISNANAVLRGVGEPQKGGIQTLYRSPTLTILNIVWSPLMHLMPHEHAMWALIGIYTGREDSIFWQRRDGRLAATTAAAISAGDVIPLPRDVIHSVTNPVEKLTGAIHIYGGDFFAVPRSEWDPETLAEREWSVQGALKLFEQSNERFFGFKNGSCPK